MKFIIDTHDLEVSESMISILLENELDNPITVKKVNSIDSEELAKSYLQAKILYRFDEEEQMIIDIIGEAYKAGYCKALK